MLKLRRKLAHDAPLDLVLPKQALQSVQASELHSVIVSSSFLSRFVALTASRIGRLNVRSRARSAGSSKLSDLRMWVTTMASGRPGMASCALPSRSRFLTRARVSTPRGASEDIALSGGAARHYGWVDFSISNILTTSHFCLADTLSRPTPQDTDGTRVASRSCVERMSVATRAGAFHAVSEKLDRASLVCVTRRRHQCHRHSSTWKLHAASSSEASSFTPSTWRDLEIDWGRRHLQVIFVDEDHGVLARAAEGCCQRVARWAGAGHMVFPESAGLNVSMTSKNNPDASMALLTRIAPVCDHPRYAARASYAFSDNDAAAVDLVISLGGTGTEMKATRQAPSASNVIDLSQFFQFAERDEIDGTGSATILQRSLALEIVAPVLEEALLLKPNEAWGLTDSDGCEISPSFMGECESDDDFSGRLSTSFSALSSASDEEQLRLKIARARAVVGVVGLVTFLLAIAPLEEVERLTKR